MLLNLQAGLVAMALLALAGCGDGIDHCAQGCDRLAQCQGAQPTPFVCGQTSAERCESDSRWHDCAHCLLDASCESLRSGACAVACQ